MLVESMNYYLDEPLSSVNALLFQCTLKCHLNQVAFPDCFPGSFSRFPDSFPVFSCLTTALPRGCGSSVT